MIISLRKFHPQTLRLIALAFVLALVVLFFATQIDNYFSARMFNRIATSAAVILPVAIGQSLVVMTRNIDLSVGSAVGVVAYVLGSFLSATLISTLSWLCLSPCALVDYAEQSTDCWLPMAVCLRLS